ncbi:MAG: alpha-2-macroglobulin family protein [Pseudomonadota bacterium]|nr:alpha-2-macroglobulin family protein [Pseudomonadota bacterium]
MTFRFPAGLAAALVLVWMAVIFPAKADSTLCEDPANAVEKVLCSDSGLRGNQAVLAQMVAESGKLNLDGEPLADLLKDQRSWEQGLEKACDITETAPSDAKKRSAAVTCLGQQIEARIAALRKAMPASATLVATAEPAADPGRPQAQVCIPFSQPLQASKTVPLDGYVTVAPAVRAGVSAAGNRLCIDGLTRGAEYKIVLKAGLPGLLAALPEDKTFSTTVPDREKRIVFPQRGSILPREGAQGLPLEAVNADRVRLTALRISDEKIIPAVLRKRLWSDTIRPGDSVGSYRDRMGQTVTYDDLGWYVASIGEKVWTGSIDMAGRKNETVRKLIPLSRTVGKLKPGLYMAVADYADRDPDRDEYWETYRGDVEPRSQWFVVSDIGATVFMGDGGMTILSRSIASARPQANIRWRLMSRDGDELATATSDKTGVARIEGGYLAGTGNDAPRALYGYGPEGDFLLMDLFGSPLDLSDRSVQGRLAAGNPDAYLYTDRGAYRPGESIHLTALVRDAGMKAVADQPMFLKIRRSDGVELPLRKFDLTALGTGTLDIALQDNAPLGQWTFSLHAYDKSPSLGDVAVLVEDFVPPRIEFTMTPATTLLPADAETAIVVKGDYLYGAPASGVSGEMAVIVRPAEAPAKGYEAYTFGLADDAMPDPVQQDPVSFVLDDDGAAQVALNLAGNVPDTSRPLEARIQTTLFDIGGRPVDRALVMPVRTKPLWLGVRASGGIDSGRFDVVALDPEGKPVAVPGVRWRLVEENREYYWQDRGNGRWGYHTAYSDIRVVDEGAVDVGGGQPAGISVPGLSWSTYRLEVEDPATGARTSLRIDPYWGSDESEEGDVTPDMVELKLADSVVKPGEKARVMVRAPFDGVAWVTVANEDILWTDSVPVTEKGNEIQVPLPEEALTGAYVMVNAISPVDARKKHIPQRAIGAVWIPADRSAHSLDLILEAPERTEPGIPVPVKLSLGSAAAGKQAYVTLAAVDEAVLQLTNFRSPDPLEYYFGQRRFPMMLWDVYGRIIDTGNIPFGQVRTGGDGAPESAQTRNPPKKTIKIVALFSGIVPVAADGTVTVPVTVPEFNGRVRLMAVAWTEDRMGHADRDMTVRRPVVAEMGLPRFLAPGDTGHPVLSLQNLDGPEGMYQLDLKTTGPLRIEKANPRIQLKPGASEQRVFQVEGTSVGDGTITVSVKGPSGPDITRKYNLTVRPASAFETERKLVQIAPGETMTPDAASMEAYWPTTVKMTVSASTLPPLDLPGHIAWLKEYSYGCVEQTSSRLVAELEKGIIARAAGKTPEPLGAFAEKGVDRLIGFQKEDGSFGMWSSTDASSSWLDSYVMDILLDARREGIDIPAAVIERGVSRLRSIVQETTGQRTDLLVQAYAHYVLARVGQADATQVRRFHKDQFGKMPDNLGRALTAAALALVGDRKEAQAAFRKLDTLQDGTMGYNYYIYGGALRNDAAVMQLMASSGVMDQETVLKRADLLSRRVLGEEYLSTQERAWIIRAGTALLRQGGMDEGGKVGNEPLNILQTYTWNQRQVVASVSNTGSAPLFGVVSTSGVPKKPQPPVAKGFIISREFRDRFGNPVSLDKVTQNNVLVAVIEGQMEDNVQAQVMVADFLPAGFELENATFGGSETSDLGWVGTLTPVRHSELRDDRYLAVLDMNQGYSGDGSQGRFRLAYMVRAVTPGRFAVPGIRVEDMYRPDLQATGAASMLTVTGR